VAISRDRAHIFGVTPVWLAEIALVDVAAWGSKPQATPFEKPHKMGLTPEKLPFKSAVLGPLFGDLGV
jgi:hypothetical protein